MPSFADVKTFIKQVRSRHFEVGAVLPSSRYLARKTTREFARLPAGPARILEAGPGTGAVTHHLIAQLRPQDELTLCELNASFCARLRHLLDANPKWAAKKRQVQVVEASIEDLPADKKFHAIVCGLPFNNFPPDLVERLLAKMVGSLEPGGTLSFFEYFGIRRVKAAISGASERARLHAVAHILNEYCRKYEIGHNKILRNFPPAVVHHWVTPTG
jgi:phospholipid N-methyltransferase